MLNSNVAPSPHIQPSKRVLQQLRDNKKVGLHRIVALSAIETALPPDILMQNAKYSRGCTTVNKHLQMDEWTYKEYFAAAIIDETTGKAMEFRDLMKIPDLKALWEHSLATELRRLAQGI